MSRTEVDRFMRDVQENSALAKALAAAGSDLDKIVALANLHGYRFTRDQAGESGEGGEGAGELSDEGLERVAGGWTAPTPNPTATGC